MNKNALSFFFLKTTAHLSNLLKDKLRTVERKKTFWANNSADCLSDTSCHAHAPEPAVRRKEEVQRNAIGSPSVNRVSLYVRTRVYG